jgi:hypothetical protein
LEQNNGFFSDGMGNFNRDFPGDSYFLKFGMMGNEKGFVLVIFGNFSVKLIIVFAWG